MRNRNYHAGNWSLPKFWTDYPPSRNNKMSHVEQTIFYSGKFVVGVLKHKGGIKTLPPTVKSKSVICS